MVTCCTFNSWIVSATKQDEGSSSIAPALVSGFNRFFIVDAFCAFCCLTEIIFQNYWHAIDKNLPFPFPVLTGREPAVLCSAWQFCPNPWANISEKSANILSKSKILWRIWQDDRLIEERGFKIWLFLPILVVVVTSILVVVVVVILVVVLVQVVGWAVFGPPTIWPPSVEGG